MSPFDLNKVFASFHLNIQCVSVKKIRNISVYDLYLSPGVRVKDLQKYADEIALILKSKRKPVFTPIHQEGIVRMDVVDGPPPKLPFWENYDQVNLTNGPLPTYLGNSISGKDICFDLSLNPHLMVSGGTGSGKSTLLHLIIANLIALNNSWIYIIDTKDVEFRDYTQFRNIQIANSYDAALDMLKCLDFEMEYRYEKLRTRSLSFGKENNPYVILLIDEFADLIIQDKDQKLYQLLLKLTQKCRAAGIYCILATQRPSIDILRGPLKANFHARIACQVASKTDSRVILDESGAELLAGNGDAIIKNYAFDFERFQCAFTTSEEIIENVRKYHEYNIAA